MRRQMMTALGGSLILLVAVGCAENKEMAHGDANRVAVLEEEVAMKEKRAMAAEARAQELESRVMTLEKTRAQGGANYAAGGNADYPPNAKPGECYARVLVPARYDVRSERVLVNPASEKVSVTPPTYKTATQRVLVREAREELRVIPAKYRTVTETVVVREPSEKLVSVPATYETVTERIKVRDAYTTWRKGRGPIERVDAATGEILCLVEVPAEYKTVKKRVVKTPATTRRVAVPGETRSITKQVVSEPARTEKVTIPAEYKTVTRRVIDRPAQERRTPIPATYNTVEKRTKVSEERLEWREILCETNMTNARIGALQRALRASGHYAGRVDGIYGKGTQRAVRAYQRQRGLPTGGLTLRTLQSLGV